MTFTETRTGDNLIVQVVFEKQTMDLPTKVVGLRGRDLIVDVIYLNKKILNLSDDKIQVHIMLIRENKVPIIWKNVTCQVVKENGQYFYQITAHGDGCENNRREAFRLFLENEGMAQFDINKKALKVIVKDVSETGFSFVTLANLNIAIGKPVRLSFEDLDIVFNLMGIVVRKVDVSENETLYGCKISVRNNRLLKYINSKQRQTISDNKKANEPSILMGTKATLPKETKKPKQKQYDGIFEEKKKRQKQYDGVFEEKKPKPKKKEYDGVFEEKNSKPKKKEYDGVLEEKNTKKKQYEITSEMKDLFIKTFNQDK